MTTDSALLQIAAQLLDVRIGLKPDASFRPRLARAVRDVAEAKHIGTEELVADLSTDASLFDALVDQVTVQESGFFRHPEHFELLSRLLLPSIQGPLRAWSAACANGQEAYSLAMIMDELRGAGNVFASDISPDAVQRTITGSFKGREMGGVSAERRRRHFLQAGNEWQVRQNLRDMLTTQRHNLLDPIPAQVAECQVVMCRNVLIYFKQRHAEQFLERLADAMDPAASLFVGAAETLWQMTDRFEPAQMGVSYVYRPIRRGSVRRSAAAALRASVPAPSLLVATSSIAKPELRQPRPPPVQPLTVRHSDQPAQLVDHTGQDFGRLGRQLLAAGSPSQAVVAFRQWAYLSPDDPTAHFQLGSALEASDARGPAARAYRAALAALDRCDDEQLIDVLHGFDPA
jgi:chemotaxis protein methyltransferase CheR